MPNKYLPDFDISSCRMVSENFMSMGINTFRKACNFVHALSYKRNSRKNQILCVLNEGCGTCSSTHALLIALVTENKIQNIKLVLCIFKMNASNLPHLKNILNQYGLSYIPEAHVFIRSGKTNFDFTFPGKNFHF